MSTVYISTRTNRLSPGSTFAFRPHQARKCVALITGPQELTFVTEGQEEPETIAFDEQRLYLVFDQRLPARWGRFLSTLTADLAELFLLLTQANPESVWGVAIHGFLQAPERPRFMALIEQLSSQAKDNPEAMATVVGQRLMERLLGYITPLNTQP